LKQQNFQSLHETGDVVTSGGKLFHTHSKCSYNSRKFYANMIVFLGRTKENKSVFLLKHSVCTQKAETENDRNAIIVQ